MKERKCIYSLALPDYPKEITDITLPIIQHYAEKIEADFRVITERKFPQWHATYEKVQIREMGEEYDWNIYIDCDAVICPDLFDVTGHLTKDTVCFTGKDMSGNRFRYDKYFLRDGRFLGACNWFTIASNWCLDLWHPLDDLTPEEAIAQMYPTVDETKGGMLREHLIDDYLLSRNIARFGLKHTTIEDIKIKLGRPGDCYYHHMYNIPADKKLIMIEQVAAAWGFEHLITRKNETNPNWNPEDRDWKNMTQRQMEAQGGACS